MSQIHFHDSRGLPLIRCSLGHLRIFAVKHFHIVVRHEELFHVLVWKECYKYNKRYKRHQLPGICKTPDLVFPRLMPGFGFIAFPSSNAKHYAYKHIEYTSQILGYISVVFKQTMGFPLIKHKQIHAYMGDTEDHKACHRRNKQYGVCFVRLAGSSF